MLRFAAAYGGQTALCEWVVALVCGTSFGLRNDICGTYFGAKTTCVALVEASKDGKSADCTS